MHSAENLLSLIDLFGPEDPAHVPVLAALAETVYGLGEIERCNALVAKTIGRVRHSARPGWRPALGFFCGLFLHGHSGGDVPTLVAELDGIIAELHDTSDDENLARAHIARGWFCFWVRQADGASIEARRAIDHAAQASAPSLEAEAVGLIVAAMRYGRTPWSELERFVDERLASGGDRLGGRLGAGLRDRTGVALAARGEFDAAREFHEILRQAQSQAGSR